MSSINSELSLGNLRASTSGAGIPNDQPLGLVRTRRACADAADNKNRLVDRGRNDRRRHV